MGEPRHSTGEAARRCVGKKRGAAATDWQRGAWESLTSVALGGLVRITAVGEVADLGVHLVSLFPTLLFFAEKGGDGGGGGGIDDNIMSLQCLLNLCSKDLGGGGRGGGNYVSTTCARLKSGCLGHPRQEVRSAAVVVRNKYLLVK